MGLGGECVEAVEGAEAVILFCGEGPAVVEVVGYSAGWVELEAAWSAGVVGIDDGVVDDVPGAEVEAEDGADFRGDGAGLPVAAVDAEFEVGGVDEFVVLRVGADEELADLEAVDGGAVVGGVGRGDGEVEALLEPRGDAVGPFGGELGRSGWRRLRRGSRAWCVRVG